MLLKIAKHLFKIVKRIVIFFFSFILIYLLIAWVCSHISTSPEGDNGVESHEIYVVSNGVHTDVIFPLKELRDDFSKLNYKTQPKFIAFGWGDKGFYLNTPTWGDLTFSTAVNAVFLESPTAMHVTEYLTIGKDWKKVKIGDSQLDNLQQFILNTFEKGVNDDFLRIDTYSYGENDTFYEAKGSYSCLRTCNTWTNEALKKAKVKTAIWTPFDWGILNHLKE